jgi:hypothetical protein
MNLEDIMLNETNQCQKDKYYMLSKVITELKILKKLVMLQNNCYFMTHWVMSHLFSNANIFFLSDNKFLVISPIYLKYMVC